MFTRSSQSKSPLKTAQYLMNNENLENKLSKIQSDIELLEKRIRLADSETRVTSDSTKNLIKKNTEEIKRLRMEVEELPVRIKRQQLAEEKIIHDALVQRCREDPSLKKCSGKDLLRLVETRSIELLSKFQSVSHRLQLVQRDFKENEDLLKEMTERCRNDDLPTEADCQQYIKDLENEIQKAIKTNEECENAKKKLKAMAELLREKQECSYQILMDFIERREKQYLNNDVKAKDKLEKLEEGSLSNQTQIEELERLEKDFDYMKEATACCHTKDIERRFLEQKNMQDDLIDMKNAAEKRLQKLKDEKRELSSKMILMKGADTVYPKKTEELILAKRRLQEQENRREAAKSELDRLNSTEVTVKDSLQKIIEKFPKKFANVKKQDHSCDESIGQLVSTLESTVIQTFSPVDHVYAAKVVKK